MSSAGITEERADETAASTETPFKDTTKGAGSRGGPLQQDGEKLHPLSRQAQEGTPNAFTIFFMALFHAGAILALFFFTWSALAVAAVLVLRRTRPQAERAFSVPGYPWVPLVFCAAVIGLIVSAFIGRPRDALEGIGLVATGIPVYLFYIRRARKSQ